jgi:aspartate/methionine/tyrosine aminotransferase
LHEEIERTRAAGRVRADLTVSNPTLVGLLHSDEVYTLGGTAVQTYEPTPLGLATAREAIAEYYGRRGVDVDPERIWLTAGTSEAYAQLCALLCDPGETIAVPTPGYPLLEHLGDVAGVRRCQYRLLDEPGWPVDFDSLDRVLDEPSLRGVVAIEPNNPTGSTSTAEDRDQIESRCRQARVPLLVDEVFADYPIEDPTIARWFPASLPSFVLSGLSKVAALPQLKLSWVIACGPEDAWRAIRSRVEILADAFLSVSTVVQAALPGLLKPEVVDAIQDRIRARCRSNLETLDRSVRGRPLDRAPVAAGWAVLLRLPALPGLDDLGWSRLVLEAGVVTQPGYLFDLEGPPRVVLSLLTPPSEFEVGVQTLIETVEQACT